MDESKLLGQSIEKHLRFGLCAILFLVGGLGSWAATTKLSGAVLASGVLVVDSNVKKVQHQNGGVVEKLFVRDGARVQAGDILLQLNDTQIRSNLEIITKRLDELFAQVAREQAERDSAVEVAFPESLLRRHNNPDVARLIATQRKLFETRKTAREGQKEQLRERITQLREEIRGLIVQQEAKMEEVSWIRKELEGIKKLWEQNLVPLPRIATLQRDLSRTDGSHGQLTAAIAQAKAKIAETELQILQIDQDLRAEVDKDIATASATIAELSEKKIAADDQMARLEIRAPQDGIIHELSVHTIGGVISPGESIMMIVPANDKLNVEAKIASNLIDRVRIGQNVKLRFSAFDLATTPEIFGIVTMISPDVTRDPKTGLDYYLVRIKIPDDEVARLGHELSPGIPVECFLQTDERTLASYLIKPLSDQMNRAFKER